MMTSAAAEPVRASLPPPPSIDTMSGQGDVGEVQHVVEGRAEDPYPGAAVRVMSSTVEIARSPIVVLLASATIDVDSGATGDGIEAFAGSGVGDGVVAIAGGDGVVAGVTGNEIVLVARRQVVVAVPAVVHVLAGSAGLHVARELSPTPTNRSPTTVVIAEVLASAVPALSTKVTVTVRRRLACACVGVNVGVRRAGDHGVDRARRGGALTPLVADHSGGSR